MNQLSFRSSRIVYYGPHACSNCGVNVCKMGHEFGGNTFNYPEGPIYPNTEWFPHVCDPKAAGYKLQHAPGTVAYTREVSGVFEAVLYTDQQRCDAERDAAAVTETNRIAEEARLAAGYATQECAQQTAAPDLRCRHYSSGIRRRCTLSIRHKGDHQYSLSLGE